MKIFLLILAILSLNYIEVKGQLSKCHVDFIDNIEGKQQQLLQLISDGNCQIDIDVKGYLLRPENKDSIVVFTKKIDNKQVQPGVNSIPIQYTNESKTYIQPDFKSILNDLKTIPPGSYFTKVSIKADTSIFVFNFYNDIDSSLKENNILRKSLIQRLASLSKTRNPELEIEKISKKLHVHHQLQRNGGKLLYSFYYHDWFIGRYEIKALESIRMQAKSELENVSKGLNQTFQNEVDNIESVSTKLKKIQERNKEKGEIKGEISLAANMSNQQDPYSNQDRNFYEVAGEIELPILSIPVSVEGYYTTQDLNRKIKSSYIRFHYNVDQAKQNLSELIGDYNQKFEQVKGGNQGFKDVYKPYLKNLGNQKDKLFNEFENQIGVENLNTSELKNGSVDTTALLNGMISKLNEDSSIAKDGNKLKNAKDSVLRVYQAAMKKYEAAMEVYHKYQKYESMVNQYQNSQLFDSLATYDKVKGLKNYEDMSYKDMAKQASSLLPEGKAKKFITGLTEFELGMFSKYTSKYTMAGQQLKGCSIGYDMGFATTKATIGKTDYIGRDGSIDRYSCYGANITSKEYRQQQIALDYYGYTPSKRMFEEDKQFFKDINTSLPTFKRPVHLVSINYKGVIVKNVRWEVDIATSIKSQNPEYKAIPIRDKLAYSISIEGDIPHSSVTAVASYENIGKSFENKSLPISMNDIEKVSAQLKGSFFKNYVQAGVEFNHLIQRNLMFDSKQTRWGFDVKTHGKRYPNIALSYKPYSTIRVLTDTLIVPQRPLLGQIWTARATYQLKKNHQYWRFMFLLNKSTSHLDTSNYESNTVQFNASYTKKSTTYGLNIGTLQMNSSMKSYIPEWHRGKSYQLGLNGAQTLSKKIQFSEGLDLALRSTSIVNYGISLSSTVRSAKIPIQFRSSVRVNRYQLTETFAWQNRIGGVLEITWHFKHKMYEKM